MANWMSGKSVAENDKLKVQKFTHSEVFIQLIFPKICLPTMRPYQYNLLSTVERAMRTTDNKNEGTKVALLLAPQTSSSTYSWVISGYDTALCG